MPELFFGQEETGEDLLSSCPGLPDLPGLSLLKIDRSEDAIEFENKRVLLAGGVGETGIGISREMLASGATVLLVDSDPSALHHTAFILAQEGFPVTTVVADILTQRGWEAAVAAAHQMHGGVDIAIKCLCMTACPDTPGKNPLSQQILQREVYHVQTRAI